MLLYVFVIHHVFLCVLYFLNIIIHVFRCRPFSIISIVILMCLLCIGVDSFLLCVCSYVFFVFEISYL